MTCKQLILSVAVMALLHMPSQATAALLPISEGCNVKHKDAQCFELTTTEQPDGSGNQIKLPVQYLPALESKLSEVPIVWLNGGPGISNLAPPLPDWIFAHFDVLVIGYRGIDGTPRLDCPNLKTRMANVQKDPSIQFLSDEAFNIWRNEVSNCQTNWQAQGYNTQAYSTLHVVNDIEQVRQALALPQLSLLSASYGTRIAWYYDQLHPGKLYRNLLLSGNPTGGFYFEPTIIDSQLMRLSEWCELDADCRDLTPNLYHSIETVLKNPPNRAWGVHVDPDHLRIVTYMLLYSRSTWPLLADAFGKAERGNYSGLAAMLKFPNPMTGSDWVWGSFFSAGAIDYAPSHDYEPALTAALQTNGLGSPLSELIFEGLSPGWQATELEPPTLRISDTATLILGSKIDVATPVERIETLWMPQLSNGELLYIEGAGHAPDHIISGGQPLASHLQNFLSGGSASAIEHFGEPVNWNPSFSLSWLVYAFWSIICLLTAAVMYGVVKVLLRQSK